MWGEEGEETEMWSERRGRWVHVPWTHRDESEGCLAQRALIELEAFGIEVKRGHVNEMLLVFRTQVQTARRARHYREARCRGGDVSCGRHGPVRPMAETS